MNTKIQGHNMPLYQLGNLFHQKARLVDVQAQLIADQKMKQVQCIKYKNQQKKILVLQVDYVVDKVDGKELLREISKIYKPSTYTTTVCIPVFILLLWSIYATMVVSDLLGLINCI